MTSHTQTRNTSPVGKGRSENFPPRMPPSAKVVVITGASKGIGNSIAHEILAQPANHQVVAIARSAAPLYELARRYPSRVAVVVGDLSSCTLGPRIVQVALARFHRIDSVVVNHAIIEPVQRVSEGSVAEWKEAYETNFLSVVGVIQAMIRPLRATRGAITILTSAASTVPYPSLGAYSSSKAALNNLAMLMSIEEKDITTVAISPGRVDTDMHTIIREKHSSVMPAEDAARFLTYKKRSELLSPELPARLIARFSLEMPRSLSGKFIQYRTDGHYDISETKTHSLQGRHNLDSGSLSM